MTTATTTRKPMEVPELDRETKAGNYFVSNYPPFSFWSPDGVPELEAALEGAPPEGKNLGLYLHIPFCRKRCHFCYFKVYTDKDSLAIRGYLNAALQELDVYARKRYLRGRKPKFVYFGGGTPSYLSVNQLHSLIDGMKARFPWDEVEEVTFECEPGTLTDKKLKAIRDIGVTRLSLGVENFDDHILAINGRAHRSPEIERAYGFAREVGFPQINIDLIAGMLEETEENWRRCLEKTVAMQPDSVTIYQMEIPYNTTIYREMKAQGKLVAPVADWKTKRRWVSEAFDFLGEHGYAVSSAYTAVRDPGNTGFAYRDQLWAGADLLSVGVASFGHLAGVHYQNQQDFEPYMAAIQSGQMPVYRAMKPDHEERLIREFILQLKLGRVEFDYFDRKFAVDSRSRFTEPMERIEAWGLGARENGAFVLNREGLLRVDRLLYEFFLPQHRTDRYV